MGVVSRAESGAFAGAISLIYLRLAIRLGHCHRCLGSRICAGRCESYATGRMRITACVTDRGVLGAIEGWFARSPLRWQRRSNCAARQLLAGSIRSTHQRLGPLHKLR